MDMKMMPMFKMTCLRHWCTVMYVAGTVIVDGLALTSSTAIGGNGFRVVENEAPLFVFKNGAKFRLGVASISNLVKNCDFEAGTQISPLTASMTVAFENLAGAPEATANASAISVSGNFAVRAADVLAGNIAPAQGTLTFRANSTWTIDDPASLASGTTYPVFTATGGSTGAPKASPSMAEAGLRMYRSSATTLSVGPKLG